MPRLLRGSVLLLWGVAAQAWAVDGVVVSLGKVVRPASGSADASVGVDWRLPWRWDDADGVGPSTRLELGAGVSDTVNGRVWRLSAQPVLHYRFAGARHDAGPFVEAAVGPAWVSRQTWAPHHDLGSRWEFASRLSAGYAFGVHELSLDFRHVSNAGLATPNTGADMLTLRYRRAL